MTARSSPSSTDPGVIERVRERRPIITPYDLLLLLALPGSLVVGLLAWVVFAVTLPVALFAGSLPASGLVGYALFYNPPEFDV